MGVFDFLHAANTKFDLENEIPYYIFRLLWFGDGVYKNHAPLFKILDFKTPHLAFSVEADNSLDPGVVYTDLPIKKTNNAPNLSNSSLYKSYKDLSPELRYQFLLWLKDTSQPTQDNFLYLFLCTLEKHLLLGNFDESLDTLYSLWHSHKNAKPFSNTANTMFAACLLQENMANLKKLMEAFQIDSPYMNLSLFLYSRYLSTGKLLPDEIIYLSQFAGFNENVHIKKNENLFKVVLRDFLLDTYKEPYLSMASLDLDGLKSEGIDIFSNPAFTHRYKPFCVPQLTTCQPLMTLLNKTLYSVQEIYKSKHKHSHI